MEKKRSGGRKRETSDYRNTGRHCSDFVDWALRAGRIDTKE